MHVDALSLTPLDREHQFVDRSLAQTASPLDSFEGKFGTYRLFRAGPLTVAIAPPTQAGVTQAAIGTMCALQDIAPRLILLCGIAACAAKKQPDDDQPR